VKILPSPLNRELEAAVTLGERAGNILMEYFSPKIEVEWKGKNNPVTAADRAASRFLVNELHSRFPEDAILSEEEQVDRSRLGAARVWMIDPMDGTREFIEHRTEFAVMIGLAIGGQPRLGAVFQPNSGKMYYAAEGTGAYLRHQGLISRLQVSDEQDFSKSVMALSRSHLSAFVENLRMKLGIQQTIQIGSLGLKVGLLSEGLAHVYVQGIGTCLWDTCGPEAILREAGGKITDKNGAALRYDVEDVRNLNGVVATNSLLHDRVIAAVRAPDDFGDSNAGSSRRQG